MGLTDIISDAITYPFSDIKKFLIVGVLVLLAGLYSTVSSLGFDNFVLSAITVIISLVFAIMLSGYSVQVIKKGIQQSNEIPDIDPTANFVDGIKAFIIQLVYYIIPILIAMVLGVFTGLVGAGLNHTAAGISVGTVLALIIFIIFSILEIVAISRFADTGDMSSAFNFGGVFEDAQRIGFLKIILFLIIAVVIAVVLSLVLALLVIIPFIGIIIGTILFGAIMVLFYNKGIGLLYSGA